MLWEKNYWFDKSQGCLKRKNSNMRFEISHIVFVINYLCQFLKLVRVFSAEYF